MGSAKIFLSLLVKDLRCIWQSKALVIASFGFSLLLVVVASFAFRQVGYGQDELRAITPGILLTVFLFSGISGLNHAFLPEYENNALKGILLAPVDSSLVYLAKFVSNLIFIGLLQIFVVSMHALFFGAYISDLIGQLVLVSFFFAVGFTALGTLFSSIAAVTKERELLLPIMLFPLLLSPSAGTVYVLQELLNTGSINYSSFWFVLLGTFDIISFTAGWVLFEFAVKE